jgi:hypothetical protein
MHAASRKRRGSSSGKIGSSSSGGRVPYAGRKSVLLYALSSPAGCYTDWHVDFGGTGVWYHMVQVRDVICMLH